MADLSPTPALAVQALEIAGTRLAPIDLGPVTAVMPYKGAALSQALQSAHGLAFPGPGEVTTKGDLRCAWSGKDQAFLIGARPEAALADHAALVDQSDSWAAFALTGPHAMDVLARLCPLDLREAAMPPGSSARSLLQHCPLLLIRREKGFEIMTFRSMAGTAWHELETALRQVAARIAQAALDQALK